MLTSCGRCLGSLSSTIGKKTTASKTSAIAPTNLRRARFRS
jgi:hypothetical protein